MHSQSSEHGPSNRSVKLTTFMLGVACSSPVLESNLHVQVACTLRTAQTWPLCWQKQTQLVPPGQPVARTRHKLEQLRQTVNKVDDLGDEE
jgi:hypothetical protein